MLPRARGRGRDGETSPRFNKRTLTAGRTCAGSAVYLGQRHSPTIVIAQQCARGTRELKGIGAKRPCEWWCGGDSNASARSGTVDKPSGMGSGVFFSRQMAIAPSTRYAGAEHAPAKRSAAAATLCELSVSRTGCAVWLMRWLRARPGTYRRSSRRSASRPTARGSQHRRRETRRVARFEWSSVPGRQPWSSSSG